MSKGLEFLEKNYSKEMLDVLNDLIPSRDLYTRGMHTGIRVAMVEFRRYLSEAQHIDRRESFKMESGKEFQKSIKDANARAEEVLKNAINQKNCKHEYLDGYNYWDDEKQSYYKHCNNCKIKVYPLMEQPDLENLVRKAKGEA